MILSDNGQVWSFQKKIHLSKVIKFNVNIWIPVSEWKDTILVWWLGANYKKIYQFWLRKKIKKYKYLLISFFSIQTSVYFLSI